MEVDGKKLVDLLMQALEEGDTVRFTEITNRLLAYKVSECLGDQRVLIAEELFVEGRAQAEVFDKNRRELKTLVRKIETAKSPAIEKQIQARIDALKKRLGIKEDIAEASQTLKQVEAEFRDVVRQLDKLKGVKSSAKKKLENRLLSLDKKKALARLGLGEDLADLVKVSNLNRDDESDAADPEDEQLPNADLARIAAADDELRNFDEGGESDGLDTFRA